MDTLRSSRTKNLIEFEHPMTIFPLLRRINNQQFTILTNIVHSR